MRSPRPCTTRGGTSCLSRGLGRVGGQGGAVRGEGAAAEDPRARAGFGSPRPTSWRSRGKHCEAGSERARRSVSRAGRRWAQAGGPWRACCRSPGRRSTGCRSRPGRIGKFLLRREIYWEGPGETWSRKHRSWLTSVRFADQASRATLADYLHAHDVLIARRDQVEADLAKLATGVPWRSHGRPVAVPARDRHADRGRVVRGDRRLRTLRPRRAADELPRPGPVESTTGHSAGSGRSPRPAPHTPAGCWSRRRGTTAAARRSARRSPTARRPAPGSDRDRLERTTPAASHLGPARGPRANAARSSRSPPPASSPASAGRSPKSNNHSPNHTESRRLGRWRPGTRGEPATAYEQPAHRGPRSILDSGSPRRTMVLRQPRPANISLTARRAQHAGPPPTQPTTQPPATTERTMRESTDPRLMS